jgi:hypothetical protein
MEEMGLKPLVIESYLGVEVTRATQFPALRRATGPCVCLCDGLHLLLLWGKH